MVKLWTHGTRENVEKVGHLVHRGYCGSTDLDRETVRMFLSEDVEMRKFSSKVVPGILADEQKQLGMFLIERLLEMEPDAHQSI